MKVTIYYHYYIFELLLFFQTWPKLIFSNIFPPSPLPLDCFLSVYFFPASPINFQSNPHRILLAGWLLGVMVLMHNFVGYMESTLMVKSETFRINTIERLIKMPKVEPMIYEVGGYKTIFEVNTTITTHCELIYKYVFHFMIVSKSRI